MKHTITLDLFINTIHDSLLASSGNKKLLVRNTLLPAIISSYTVTVNNKKVLSTNNLDEAITKYNEL